MRSGAILILVAALALGACADRSAGLPSGPARNPDAGIYDRCDTYCLRPGDCAVSYNDDGICPAGFRCARTFSCVRDGGATD